MFDPDDCGRCALYVETRGPRIKAEIAKTHSGAEAAIRFHQFMEGYHNLHRTAGRYVALMALFQEGQEDPE